MVVLCEFSLPSSLHPSPIPFFLLCIGLSWLLSSLGIYLRDIGHITPMLTMILLFLSTIFYPAHRLPENYQYILYLNPLSWVVDQLRYTAILGQTLDIQGYLIYSIIGLVCMVLGAVCFHRLKPGFADAL